MRDHLGARPKGGHCTVADGRQAGGLSDLADFGDLRQIQRIISRVPGYDRRGPRQTERVEGGHGALHRREIGPMILAVTALAQAFRRDAGRSGRRVDARYACVQIVDAHHTLMACALAGDPAFLHTQVVKHRCQPSVVQIAWLDLSTDEPTERPLMRSAPRLDASESVVALGEHAGQPDDRDPAETHARPIAVGRKMVVQSWGHAHVLEMRDDDRYIIDSLMGCSDCWRHPPRLAQCVFSRDNSLEMSVSENENFRISNGILGFFAQPPKYALRNIFGGLGKKPLALPINLRGFCVP